MTIDGDLLREAKALKLNLSATFEGALKEAVRQHRRAAWVAENRKAIEAYNAHVEKNGVFSDGRRQF